MKKITEFFIGLWAFVTLKPHRARREAALRRKNYETLKAQVVEEHLRGFGGMIVDPKYDMRDLDSFLRTKIKSGLQMYYVAKNTYGQVCLFWDKKMMTEEVGPPRPKPELAPHENQ